MKNGLALCLASAYLGVWRTDCDATPLPFSMEGSGGAELGGLEPAWYTTRGPALTSRVAGASDGARVEPSPLTRVADFLQENLLLVLAVSSLLCVAIFAVCCASFVGRRRKASAYYPSAFPVGRYVDERDKSGGTRAFSEVPERPPDAQRAGPVDSAKQLQAEIKMAAKNLRTPSKAPVMEDKDLKPEATETTEPQETAQAQEPLDQCEGSRPQIEMLSRPSEPQETAQAQEPLDQYEGSRPQIETSSRPKEPQASLGHQEEAELPKEGVLKQEVDPDTAPSVPEEPEAQQEEAELPKEDILKQEVDPDTAPSVPEEPEAQQEEAELPKEDVLKQEVDPDTAPSVPEEPEAQQEEAELPKEGVLKQEVDPDTAPSVPEEPEAQQEERSEVADVQEVVAPVVQIIKAETAAF